MRLRFLKPALLAATAALALSACATATPYGPAGVDSRYGYADQRVDADRYRVSFSGNSVTSREQVEMALLLRAAEVTAESGYDWFSTVNRATDRDVRLQGIPDPFYRDRYSPFWGPSWRYYRRGYWSPWGDPFWGSRDFDVREIDRFEASAEIVMGRGPKPAGDPNAFDAREVIQNLGPRVTRPM
ncbi:CC0125/CC1285 family lipoprotein [Brevundimonas sp.]|uniref:CC0125/CC1285 family lipoprotein n=1 Tax=Brevundimonas sp. TaxID=1871086 RepID=UPI003F71EF56